MFLSCPYGSKRLATALDVRGIFVATMSGKNGKTMSRSYLSVKKSV